MLKGKKNGGLSLNDNLKVLVKDRIAEKEPVAKLKKSK